MRFALRLDWRFTFVADFVVFLLLTLVAGMGWFGALLLTEAVFWMIRLLWLSPLMLRFIVRRLIHMIPIIIIVIALAFLLVQLAPGDIFSQMALNPAIDACELERLRDNFGLNKPWYVQFFLYIWNALRGNFGYSENFKAPVFALVGQRATNTLILAVTSLLFAWGLSIPFGVIAATKQYRWQDQTLSVFAFVGLAIPNFFLAFLLIFLIGSTGVPLLIGGMRSINSSEYGMIRATLDIMHHLILPVFVLGTSAMVGLTRIMRANMLDVLGQQYIVTARSKGQTERRVVFRHALRNAINPMVTILGFQLGSIMSGAALVENVIGWPGLGRLILLAVVDPRIRIG